MSNGITQSIFIVRDNIGQYNNDKFNRKIHYTSYLMASIWTMISTIIEITSHFISSKS